MESIKDKVAIIGMGCTKFGELWDKDVEDLAIDAAYEAYEDAGIDPKDIQAAWVGAAFWATGMMLSVPLKLDYIPVTRVENVCGTGIEEVRAAAYALACKAYDMVLAVGIDKIKDAGVGGMAEGTGAGGGSDKWHPVYSAGVTAPGRYALAATRYFYQYGLGMEEGKKVLAQISVKAHDNGAINPRAHLRRKVTVEQVINAPMICWPLGLYDCCGVTDGASAAVLVPSSEAKAYRNDYVNIKAFSIATGPGWGKEDERYDFTYWKETQEGAKAAYADAGIKDPRKELSLVELHDCVSIAELICCESLFLCEPGKFKEEFTEKRAYYHDGEMPINVSGGLKSFGHPIGASGAREIAECVKQLQGKVEEPSRQIANFELGLAHNQGGHPGRFVPGIAI